MDDERQYRKYATEFKLEALEMLKRGNKSAGEIERDLGITPGLLVKWRARYQIIQKGEQEVRLGPSDLESAKATYDSSTSKESCRSHSRSAAFIKNLIEKQPIYFLFHLNVVFSMYL
jgi:transposase-like protein